MESPRDKWKYFNKKHKIIVDDPDFYNYRVNPKHPWYQLSGFELFFYPFCIVFVVTILLNL